jgi:hypothetical protein
MTWTKEWRDGEKKRQRTRPSYPSDERGRGPEWEDALTLESVIASRSSDQRSSVRFVSPRNGLTRGI